MARPWENNSGAKDPTAWAGSRPIIQEEDRLRELMKVIRYVVRLAGFEIIGRIEFRDIKSGRTYR